MHPLTLKLQSSPSSRSSQSSLFMPIKTTFTLLLAALLAACAGPRPRPVVKIALAAPFEGRLRQVGYDAFPALRLAIRAAIEASKSSPGPNVTFIAYNDNGDALQAEQVARDIAIDPEVVAVIGHWLPATTLVAVHVYTEAGLPLLAPGIPASVLPQDAHVFRMGPTLDSPRETVHSATCEALAAHISGSSPGPTPKPVANGGAGGGADAGLGFGVCRSDAPPLAELPDAASSLHGFTDLTLGTPPAPRSAVAFDAANVIIAAIHQAASSGDGVVTRSGVTSALQHVSHRGLLGTISFDPSGVWAGAPLWIYPN